MFYEFMAMCVALLVASVWLKNRTPQDMPAVQPRYLAREWLAVSIPLYVVTAMYVVIAQTDTVMLGMITGTTESGIYSVSSRIAGITVFGISAVNIVIAPSISSAWKNFSAQVILRFSWGNCRFFNS